MMSLVSDEGSKPHRRGRYLVILLVVILLLLVDGLYVAVKLGTSLTSAASDLKTAKTLLADGRIDEARKAAGNALEAGNTAAGLKWHPAYLLARAIPWVGNDARAVSDLGIAAQDGARAAATGVDAASLVTAPGAKPGSRLYDNGTVQLNVAAAAQPLVHRVALALEDAVGHLQNAPRPHISIVRDKLTAALDNLAPAATSAHKADAALTSLPDLLGADRPRRYFLAFQSPSEARGTGGLIGFYGILTARDGSVALRDVKPIGRLRRPSHEVPAPGWFSSHYGPQDALKTWQQVNLSPDFPVVARVMLRMYRDATGQRLDGVIAMDPIVLGELTRGTGPIPSPGLGADISEANASEVLLRDAYALDDFVQEPALTSLLSNFFAKLSSDTVDTNGLLDGFGAAVSNQHLKVYATDATTEDALRVVALDGWSEAPNLQEVWHTSASSSKVDYFLTRNVDTVVKLGSDETATVTVTTTMKNTATPQPGTELTGPGFKGDPEGLNRMYLNYLMPVGATLKSFTVDGSERKPFRAKEGDHPVAWDEVKILAGHKATVRVVYEIPAPSASTGFSITLQPQATVTPDGYSLSVSPPPGTHFEGIPGGSFRQEGLLDHEVGIHLSLPGSS
jgi:hypothetical protein